MSPTDDVNGVPSDDAREAHVASVSPDGDEDLPRDHANWLHWLFAVGDGEHVLVVSAATGVVFFVSLYLVSVGLGLDRAYLDPSTVLGLSAYAGSLGIFVVLVMLGRWTTSYVSVWRQVAPCFATDERSFETFLDARVERLFQTRYVVGVFLPFESFFAFVVNDLNPLDPREAVLTVINATVVFLAITALWMFLVHFGTMRRATDLGIENAFTAARKLEPLTRLNMNTSFWWFLGVTVLSLYYWLWLSDYLRYLLLRRAVEPAQPLPIPVVVHATLFGLLISVGIALVAVPLWQMHLALTRAKDDLLTDIDDHYSQIVHEWATGGTPDDVATELSAAEQARAVVTGIQTWPYDARGVVKLLLSSVIPLTQFALTSLLSVLGVQ